MLRVPPHSINKTIVELELIGLVAQDFSEHYVSNCEKGENEIQMPLFHSLSVVIQLYLK